MTAPALCLACQRRPGCGIGSTARGLCSACYCRHTYHGTLADFPRATWPAGELLDEWVLLRDDGCSVADAAARLGVTFAALSRALCRAQARGDVRGRRAVFGRDLTGARADEADEAGVEW